MALPNHNSQFFARALKGAFPDMENYQYFRPVSDGFDKCVDLPALGIMFAFRERMRSEEWTSAASQCGVSLPSILNCEGGRRGQARVHVPHEYYDAQLER